MVSRQQFLTIGSRALLGLMLALTVNSCVVEQGAEAPASSEAAAVSEDEATGSITIYTAIEDDQIDYYLEGFKEAYPDIEVNIVRDSTGIITAKLLAEKDNPQADLVWGLAASSLVLADQQGLLEPYAPEGLDKVEPKFRDSKNPPHWVGIDVWMAAFCVNTKEIEAKNLPMPDSWEDLADPVYQGHIVKSNPASSGTGFLAVSSLLQMKGEEEGWKYLDALHNNIAQYTHSGSKPCKMAGAGEFPIGISFGYRAVKQKADGEPVEPVFPAEGSGWEMEANALIKKDQIKPAAKIFLDWAISPEISEKYAEGYAITAVKTSKPVPEGFPADPLKQLAENDFEWAAANRERILDEWTKRYDGKSEPKS